MLSKDDPPTGFAPFPLLPEMRQVLDELGFLVPTPIQAEALPHALAGRDVIGKAQTGTGKTLAFGLPLVQGLDPDRGAAQALVLLPTRELAQQVVEHLRPFAEARGLGIVLVVGGERIMRQRPRIPGKQIVVGTPGRILDFLKQGVLHCEWVSHLVLDEFDRMLDMGFIDDVERIVSYVPRERQTMLFSATIPPASLPMARNLARDPVNLEVGRGLQAAALVEQRALRMSPRQRLPALLWLLKEDMNQEGQTVMVFANTRRAVADLDRELWGRNLPSSPISGDFDQQQRFKVMAGFRAGIVRVLVATDVASRGLDLEHVGHVINFDVPLEAEDYVHRLGRTGRAGRKGMVTTLLIPAHERAFQRIQARLKGRIRVGRLMMRDESPARDGHHSAGPRVRREGDGRGGSRQRRRPRR